MIFIYIFQKSLRLFFVSFIDLILLISSVIFDKYTDNVGLKFNVVARIESKWKLLVVFDIHLLLQESIAFKCSTIQAG